MYKKNFWRGLGLGGVVFGYFMAMQMAAGVLAAIPAMMAVAQGASVSDAMNEVMSGDTILWASIIAAVVSFLGLYLLHAIRRKSFTFSFKMLEINKIKPTTALVAVVAAFAMWLMVSCGIDLIPFPDSWFEQFSDTFASVTNGPLWLQIAFVGVLGPINEEFCLRGGVMNLVRRDSRPFVGIIVSGLLFGAMHMIPLQMCYAAVIGIVLGIVMQSTKSLVSCIIMHIVNNTWVTLLPFIPGVSEFLSKYIVGWYAVAACAIGAIVLALCVFLMLKLQKGSKYRRDIPWESRKALAAA